MTTEVASKSSVFEEINFELSLKSKNAKRVSSLQVSMKTPKGMSPIKYSSKMYNHFEGFGVSIGTPPGVALFSWIERIICPMVLIIQTMLTTINDQKPP